jgi:prophage endopeptidase
MRRRQEGNELYVALGAVLLIVLIVAGFMWYVGSERRAAFAAGEVAERGRWQAKESKELSAANAEILRLTKLAQDLEAKRAAALAKASADYQKGLADGKRELDAAVAAARSGALVLRDPGRTTGACPPGGAAAATEPGAGGRDGAKGGELSREASAFLLELTGEADAVAKQLTACQAVVRADREP